MKVDTLTNLGM